MQGGDLRQALTQAPAQLHWYNKGASVALDIVKGLHFLHKHKVTLPSLPDSCDSQLQLQIGPCLQC